MSEYYTVQYCTQSTTGFACLAIAPHFFNNTNHTTVQYCSWYSEYCTVLHVVWGDTAFALRIRRLSQFTAALAHDHSGTETLLDSMVLWLPPASLGEVPCWANLCFHRHLLSFRQTRICTVYCIQASIVLHRRNTATRSKHWSTTCPSFLL